MHILLRALLAVAIITLAPLAARAGTFVDEDRGFSLELPDGTTLTALNADEWEHEDNIAFDWTASTDGALLATILGTVDEFDEEISDELFDEFMTGVDEGFKEQRSLTVLNATDDYEIDGRVWSSRLSSQHFEDVDAYVETFSTAAGPNVYTFTVLYSEEPGDEHYAAVEEMLATFTTDYDG